MKELFVDVDTLVTWPGAGGVHPYGRGARGWEPNKAVIAYVKQWREDNPLGIVIVWSGGSQKFAGDWAAAVLPGLYHGFLSKDGSVTPTKDRTFIDDLNMFEGWPDAHVIHPKDLPEA